MECGENIKNLSLLLSLIRLPFPKLTRRNKNIIEIFLRQNGDIFKKKTMDENLEKVLRYENTRAHCTYTFSSSEEQLLFIQTSKLTNLFSFSIAY